jgi:4-amino-4-deoxy-L-arabinose transferase-like glycosyltransferase
LNRPRARPPALLAVLALLVAAALRRAPLLDNRFHPDEALYASYASRIASGRDPLLAGVLVDKPPLPFYLSSLSLALVGPGELAARLPSFYASLAGVALLYALARRLYGSALAAWAAWLLALSPFDVLFAVTAFIDPLLAAACLAFLWASAAGRPRPAGLLLALAFAVKQTALLFVPLGLVFSLLNLRPSAGPAVALRHLVRAAWPALTALAVAAALVFAWDAVRRPEVGFWAQGYADNVPGRFVRANEVLPRAAAWVGLLHYATASLPLNLFWLAGLPLLLALGSPARSRPGLADRLIAGYLLAYLGAYWLLAFNVWDRYLLPVLPLGLLLLARLLLWAAGGPARALHSIAGRSLSARLGPTLVVLAVATLLLPPARAAAQSRYPVGGDHGAYDGVDHAAAFLRTLPEGTVLYDHWLSWQWNFYLFDGPVYVAWFPTPDAFARDLRAFGSASPRYLVVPAWESDAELRAAAASAGFAFEPRFVARRRDGPITLTVFALVPP